MSNCGEYNFNMFVILPAYFNTLCNITTWGELVSESGASAFLTDSAVITHDVTTDTGYCLVGFNWIIDFLISQLDTALHKF